MEQSDDYRAAFLALPAHMHGAVTDYIERGAPTGDFLFALFSNNLTRVITYADPENMRALLSWVQYMDTWMPIDSWGSAEKVLSWERRGGRKGIMKGAKTA